MQSKHTLQCYARIDALENFSTELIVGGNNMIIITKTKISFMPCHWLNSLTVQFSPLTDWVIGGRTWGMIQQRSSSSLFCRRPLWAAVAWAGMSTLWRCPSSISSADHPPRCPKGWFWRGCRGVWHARTMRRFTLCGKCRQRPQADLCALHKYSHRPQALLL